MHFQTPRYLTHHPRGDYRSKNTNKIEQDRHHPTIFFPVLDLQIRLSGRILRIPSVGQLLVQILDLAVVRHLPLVPSSPAHVA